MPRRSFSRQPLTVELFPFLSVLACTIGTLVLLIIVLTSQTLSYKQEVTIVAETENGQNQAKTPRYLEVRQDGVVLYPSQELVPAEQIEDPNSPLQQFLNQVQQRWQQEYIIVAVRPDGIEVFKDLRYEIEERGIDLGYEPIDQGWQLKTPEPSPTQAQ